MADRGWLVAGVVLWLLSGVAQWWLAGHTPLREVEPTLARAAVAAGHGDWSPVDVCRHGPVPLWAAGLAADPRALARGAVDAAPDAGDPAGGSPPADRAEAWDAVRAARRGMLALALATLGAVAALAGALGGRRAAVCALAVAALDPTLLGHGHLLSDDLAGALGLLVVTLALWHWRRVPGWTTTLALGVVLGLALACDPSRRTPLFVVGAVTGLAVLGDTRPSLLLSRRVDASHDAALVDGLLGALLVGAVALATLHACYPATSGAPDVLIDGPRSEGLAFAASLPPFGDLLAWLPTPYLRGLDAHLALTERLPSRLAGELGAGFPSYGLLGMAIKLPLVTLVLLLVMPWMAWRGWPRGAVMLWVAAVAVPLAALSLADGGQRLVQLVPLWPLLMVGAGGTLAVLVRRAPRVAVVVGLLSMVHAAGAWPEPLESTSTLAGDAVHGLFPRPAMHRRHPRSLAAGLSAAQGLQPEATPLTEHAGPRFGRVLLDGEALWKPDSVDPARVRHWAARFAPSARYADWLLYELTPELFAARVTGPRDARGQLELAIAWARERDAVQTRAWLERCLEPGADGRPSAARRDPRLPALREVAAGLERGDLVSSRTWYDLGQYDLLLADPELPALVRARCLALTGRPDEALVAFEAARDSPDMLARDRLTVAALLFEDGRQRRALELLEDVREGAPAALVVRLDEQRVAWRRTADDAADLRRALAAATR